MPVYVFQCTVIFTVVYLSVLAKISYLPSFLSPKFLIEEFLEIFMLHFVYEAIYSFHCHVETLFFVGFQQSCPPNYPALGDYQHQAQTYSNHQYSARPSRFSEYKLKLSRQGKFVLIFLTRKPYDFNSN